jgi:hypothetical protein
VNASRDVRANTNTALSLRDYAASKQVLRVCTVAPAKPATLCRWWLIARCADKIRHFPEEKALSVLQTLFESGRIVDLILLLVALEATLLAFYRHLTGRGPRLIELAPTLLSGALLLLTVRAAIADAGWVWLAAPVTLALLAHLWDIKRRWR